MTPYDHTDHTGYTQIFNGKDMDGWDYPPTVYKVIDGSIVAGYDPHMSTGTTFATYTRATPGDFDLLVDIKGSGNTGVQFRSFQNDITSTDAGPNKAQLRELAKIDGDTVPKMDAVADAQAALAAAAFKEGADRADIQAKSQALSAALLDLSQARAEAFAKIQSSSNKLTRDQVATFAPRVSPTSPIVGNPIWNVAGYQADFGGANTANIWEGGRFGAMYNGQRLNERGNLTTAGNITITEADPAGRSPKVLATLPTADAAGPFYKPDDWNQYHIMARGNTMILFINGHMMSMTIDQNPVMRRTKGIIALQIEGGRWEFRNIWLKEAPIEASPEVFTK